MVGNASQGSPKEPNSPPALLGVSKSRQAQRLSPTSLGAQSGVLYVNGLTEITPPDVVPDFQN